MERRISIHRYSKIPAFLVLSNVTNRHTTLSKKKNATFLEFEKLSFLIGTFFQKRQLL